MQESEVIQKERRGKEMETGLMKATVIHSFGDFDALIFLSGKV